MRFLAFWPDMAATVDGEGVQIHQFVTGSVEAPVAGGLVRLSMETAYPWEGRVDIGVAETVAEPWTLSIRVPGWCSNATATVAGGEPLAARGPGSIVLKRTWHAGDHILVSMDMDPRTTVPDPRIDAIRGTIALERGPLVYAVEDADLPAGSSVEGLEVAESPRLEVVSETAPGIGETRTLALQASLRQDDEPGGWPYGSSPDRKPPILKAEIRAVPYFAWGNRAGLGMRVWLPTTRTPDDGC
jgi:hypothetical protein